MIRPLGIADINTIVDLHHKVLWWSINSRLGKEHLYVLYSTLLMDPLIFGFGYFDKSNKLIGISLNSLNYAKTRKGLLSFRNFHFKRLLSFIWQNFFKPLNIIDVFENAFLIPRLLKNVNMVGEIVIFITDTEVGAMQPFAAIGCYKAALIEFKKRNIQRVFAQVASYDLAPNRFQQKAGNKLLKSFWRNNLYSIKF